MGLSRYFLYAFIAALLLFSAFPELDIQFSAYFYDPVNHFYLAEAPVCHWIYKSVEIVSIIWTVLAILLLLVAWVRKKSSVRSITKHLIYLLTVLAIGPGLIVNVIMKDNWGRARPYAIQQFGGAAHFTPAFVISQECHHNCSFVSGHAAMGFYFIAFGFAFYSHKRLIFLMSSFYGTMVGLIRIIQGGHFLSDVVFAFFIVYAVASLLYDIMLKRKSIT